MKNVIIILIIVVTCCSFRCTLRIGNITDEAKENTAFLTPIPPPPIAVIFFQDVSGSIRNNGVELTNSSIFNPYFATIDRTITIHFGCICNLSAHKLISIQLQAATFRKPILSDIRQVSITEKRKLKEHYADSLQQYERDSANYFASRKASIATFCHRLDSLIAPYKQKLSSETDLVTAVEIANRAFNFNRYPSTKCVLILNSDGQDSRKRIVRTMSNKPTVILVNAGAQQHTSIDSIVTLTLQSPEQAIEFSLTNFSILKP